MANQEHLAILKRGVKAWNQWRQKHPDVQPDLRSADLSHAYLDHADLSKAILVDANLLQAHLSRANFHEAVLYEASLGGANLSGTNLSGAYLNDANLGVADLSDADLSDADLWGANLNGANLHNANLRKAYLRSANLLDADLSDADLSDADLTQAKLIETNLTGATLNQCIVYGISAWNVQLERAKQESLVITREIEPTITVDNLEVAQFIYLLLNNEKIREVIETITSKVVLILGRFTPQRKAILDALKDALRARNYSPIVFDFEVPGSRDITETVSLLARMARFVIADLTDAKSIPQELSVIIPDLPSVPVQPLAADHGYSMFEHFRRYPWVLKDFYYTSVDDLLPALEEHIISPAEQKVQELKRSQ